MLELILFPSGAKVLPMHQDLSVLDIGALSKVQFAALRQLRVSQQQEILGKSFLESIADWKRAPKGTVLGLCFALGEGPVGLVIFKRQIAPDPLRISVHGLKIALPWQQMGFGHHAFRLAVDFVKVEWPAARWLSLAVDAQNHPALAVYRKFGMVDLGPIFDGPNGKEHRMELCLRP